MFKYRLLRGGFVMLLALSLLSACSSNRPAPSPISLLLSPTRSAAQPTAEPQGVSPTSIPTATAIPTAADTAQFPPFIRTLQVQDPPLTGEDVTAVEQRLAELGYANPEYLNGAYTDYLAYVVRVFQAGNGLEVDGIVGPKTWGKLFSELIIRDQPLYPIVALSNYFSAVLGGSQNGAWIDSILTAASLTGDETYRLYALDGAIGTAKGSRTEDPLVAGPCEMLRPLELEPAPPKYAVIALAADWDALPRIPEQLPVDSEIYRQAVADLLATQGIEQPDVHITKILRTDLEGDGVDEVLINATRLIGGAPLPQAAAGDYSLVALRRVAGSEVETITVAAEYHFEDQQPAAPSEFVLDGVFDLNGDGTLEIIISHAYYEGGGISAYAIDGGQVEAIPALSIGCGH
ncbi:MAG: hypothetical protein KatS3mg057_2166 [Herpetosiphonaceae bacterium]|nr:MAG: hypothetical protein KatS3mg057_2166 [Herpetosiphonaceae bacterium]